MAYCLNPKLRQGHYNPDYSFRCGSCDFLVKGAQIADYTVISFLGRGSFGDVYEVQEPPPLERNFALKMLRFDKSGNTVLDSIAKDAEYIAKLQHQHILPVYKFGKLEDDRPYFIMEYAVSTLGRMFLNENGHKKLVRAEELISFIEQAAEALHFIHQNGYVHQDIKPENLLVVDKPANDKKQLFLSDFGIACYLGLETQANLSRVMGTPEYMAPEQWNGHSLPATDQYAFAISIYELLVGRRPFDDFRREQMEYAQKNLPPPSPLKWNPRIPIEVEVVLLRALSKGHLQRYPNILEFARSYREAVNIALKRYVCNSCGFQNRTGAQSCSNCGKRDGTRTCPFCDTPIRLGQRCCPHCGRLTVTLNVEQHNAFSGLSISQGRYVIDRILKYSNKVLVVVAEDGRTGEKVVLKRLQKTDLTKDFRLSSEALVRLNHPLIPHVLDRFLKGDYSYIVFKYIDGESLEERLYKLLKPLSEREVTLYLHALLNILAALESKAIPYLYCDITPANIILENLRSRVFLTGFQLPSRHTRKMSPYQPLQGEVYDQCTLMYALAACMHQALTTYPPLFGQSFPPVRTLNPTVSPTMEAILNRALMEDKMARYQSYAEMLRDVKKLL